MQQAMAEDPGWDTTVALPSRNIITNTTTQNTPPAQTSKLTPKEIDTRLRWYMELKIKASEQNSGRHCRLRAGCESGPQPSRDKSECTKPVGRQRNHTYAAGTEYIKSLGVGQCQCIDDAPVSSGSRPLPDGNEECSLQPDPETPTLQGPQQHESKRYLSDRSHGLRSRRCLPIGTGTRSLHCRAGCRPRTTSSH